MSTRTETPTLFRADILRGAVVASLAKLDPRNQLRNPVMFAVYLGSTLTTLTLMHDREMAAILELPDGISHCALIPVAYYTGDTFQRVERLPVRTVTYLDRWHQALPG